jgi:hypothetical protein
MVVIGTSTGPGSAARYGLAVWGSQTLLAGHQPQGALALEDAYRPPATLVRAQYVVLQGRVGCLRCLHLYGDRWRSVHPVLGGQVGNPSER